MRLGLAALLFLATPAWADDHREALMDLLNTHEEMNTEAFADLGDGVDAELMAIARDADVPPSRRGRAITALANFKTEDARLFLESQVDDTEAEDILRRKAVWSLANTWGQAALPKLETALQDDSHQLRMATARALAEVEGGEALLKARLDTEEQPAVREVIQTALGGR